MFGRKKTLDRFFNTFISFFQVREHSFNYHYFKTIFSNNLLLIKLFTLLSLKRDSNTGVSCEHCENFKSTYIVEHPANSCFCCFPSPD